MIEKIISGGQTGVEQAALDVAFKLDIPHGGRIPKDRKTEDATLSKKIRVKEMGNTSYPGRIDKNVVDSDGTLIFTHGALSGRASLAHKVAKTHGRPCSHIDLNQTNAFNAAMKISAWVEDNAISVLNITGSKASEDTEIYATVKSILESVYFLGLSKGHKPESLRSLFSSRKRGKATSTKPRTVNEAVEDLIFKLPLKDKATVANMTEDELPTLYLPLGNYIRNNFGLLNENNELISDCRFLLKKDSANEDDCSVLIIEKLWERLNNTHRLRIVK